MATSEQEAVIVEKALAEMNKADGQVFRLRDLEVQEVSLVDRPANQRKFLIVKSDTEDSTMPKGAALKKNDKGELEKPTPAAPKPTAKDDDTDDGAGGGDGDGDGDATGDDDGIDFGEDIDEAVKEGLTLSPAVKGKVASTLAKVAKRLGALAQAVANAEEGEGDDMPPKLAREIGTIARQLGTLVPSGGDDDKKKSEAEKSAKLEAAYAAVDEVRELQKAGRKISGANMKKLQDALAIIQELTEALDTPPKGVESTKKSEDAEPSAEVVALTKAVDQLTKVVKRQGATIQKLRGGRPTPNSGADGESPAQPQSSAKWPRDFNADTDEEDIF